MLKIKKLPLLIVFSVLLSSFIYVSALSVQTISAPNEIAVLQTKVDTLENLNERILNSVYWTLGVIATIFLGLISINFYFNFSGLKREIKNIKEEFTKSTESNIFSSEAKILTQINILNKEQSETIKSELLGIIKNEISTSESQVFEKVSSLNAKEFESIKTEILGASKNEVLTSEAKMIEKINGLDKIRIAEMEKIKRDFGSLKGKIDDIEITVKEFEIERFAAKGQQGAIMGLIELLEKSVDKDRYDTSDRLVKIKEYIKDHPIRSYVAVSLNKVLAKLDTKIEYKPQIEEIRALTKTFAD